MAALDSPHVPAAGKLLSPETRRVGHIAQWQFLQIQDFVTMQVRERNLCCANQPQVVLSIAIYVVCKLGKLARTPHALLFDD